MPLERTVTDLPFSFPSPQGVHPSFFERSAEKKSMFTLVCGLSYNCLLGLRILELAGSY